MELLQTGSLLLLLLAGLVCDLRLQRLPNVLTLSGLLTGVSIHTIYLGLTGIGVALLGAATGLILLLPLYQGGGMGAGDVKFMAALGSLLGLPAIALVVAVTLIGGMLIAFALLAVHGELGAWVQRRRHLLRTAPQLAHQLAPLSAAATPALHGGARRFPYMLAIAPATLLVLGAGTLGPAALQQLQQLVTRL